MTEARKLSVFLCHSPADKASALDLYRRLGELSWIIPWLDEKDILAGQNRRFVIEQALENADVIIVHLSKVGMNEEGGVHREFNLALDAALEKPEGSIYILPVRSDKCELPQRLKHLQAVDYFPTRARPTVFDLLLKSLKARADQLGITLDETARVIETFKPEPKQSKKSVSTATKKFDPIFVKAVTSPANFPVRGIPFKENKNFTGRAEILNLIRQEFGRRQNKVPAYALIGMGGIGKTQTAVAYSYQYINDYDLIWWIRSETQASIAADYQALSDALQLPLKNIAEQSVYVNLINNFLESTEKRWLLVYDNAESKEQIEPLLPKGGNGHVLITSQNPDWQSIAQYSRLQRFSPEEARLFFEKRIEEKNPDQADKLAELLGWLPLGMEQACAYIDQRGNSMEIYMHLFKEHRQQLWQLEDAPRDYKATIATTWEMAFQQIRQSQPVAEELLTLFSFLAPEDIPTSMLQTYSEYLPSNVAETVKSPLALEECLRVLYRYSLITRAGEYISLHRLVQDVVRDRLNEADRKKWLEIALQIVERAFPYDEDDFATWSQCAPISPHALVTAGYAESYGSGLELASDIYQKTGEYFNQQDEYDKAEQAIQHALEIRREILGESHEKLAASLNYMGEICYHKGKYDEASKLFYRANEILEAKYSMPEMVLGRNLNNIGLLCRARGDFKSARDYFEKALRMNRALFGENHPNFAASLSSLGRLAHSEGDFKNARIYYEKALEISLSTIGENHPNTATILNNFGLALYDQGNVDQAKEYYEKALTIDRKAFGENSPSLASIINNVGLLFQKRGDFEAAQKYYEEALEIVIGTLGKNHPHVATCLHNVGGVLAQRSKYLEARPYLEQALVVRQKLFGTKHPDLIIIFSNLAITMFHLGLHVQAREYAGQAIKICAEATDKYVECDQIKQLRKTIPMIGKKKRK